MKKKEKIGNLKKKVILEKKRKKKEKKGKVGGKCKKKIEKSTVNYCCNPQWFVCGVTVISPHHLEYYIIFHWPKPYR